MRRRRLAPRALAAAAILAMTGPLGYLRAQTPETGPKVGDVAPDFALGGATRYGVLKEQLQLSNYRGSTVVLAFFFKARTKG